MKSLPRTLLAAAMAGAGVLATTAAPASAEPIRSMDITGWATCDSAAAEWVITWSVTNNFDVAGTLGNVRVAPAEYPLTGLASVVEPSVTESGTQRIPASESSAGVVVDINWHDGPVTYNVYRPSYIKASCH